MTDVSDCGQLHRALKAHQDLGEDLLRHAESCEPCAELLAQDASLAKGLLAADAQAPEQIAEDALARLHGRLAQDARALGSLRSLSTPLRLGIASVAVVGLLATVAAAMLRPDIDVYPRLRLYASLAAHLVLVAALLRLALWRLDRALPPRGVELALFGLGALVPLGLALLPQAHTAHPASLGGVGSDFLPRAAACFFFGSGFAVVTGAVMWLLSRAPRSPRSLFVFAGAGVLGAATLELHCALTEPLHLGAGHATVALGAGLLVLALRRRLSPASAS
ncbi:MAG: hypothetical protein R3B13_40925 [Polyangiaceae bacterium]